MKPNRKNLILLFALALMLFICYKLAIENTIEQKNLYNKLITESKVFREGPNKMIQLRQREKYLDSLLTTYQISGLSLQNNLLTELTEYGNEHNLMVIDFLEPHKVRLNALDVHTYSFVLKGDYNAIMNLVHHLEQNTKFGEVCNLQFEKKKDHRKGLFYLEARVLVKSFGSS